MILEKRVEDFFINSIRDINTKKFKSLLDNNISFIEYFQESLPNPRLTKGLLKMFNVKTDLVTPNYILNLLKVGNKPAYLLLINHPNGANWLRKTIYDLKNIYG